MIGLEKEENGEAPLRGEGDRRKFALMRSLMGVKLSIVYREKAWIGISLGILLKEVKSSRNI